MPIPTQNKPSIPLKLAPTFVLTPYSGSPKIGTQYTLIWTMGSPLGSSPGGNNAAIFSGSVRYDTFSFGHPPVSPGCVKCSLIAISVPIISSVTLSQITLFCEKELNALNIIEGAK